MIPFNKPYISGNYLDSLNQVITSGKFSGDGFFCKEVKRMLKELYSGDYVVLTPSCSSALEMACRLVGLQPGDEVIMPSFTHPATANAVVNTGASPVFVDINPNNGCIDLEAITEKTKAVIFVDYAGNESLDYDTYEKLRNLRIATIQDSAQSITHLTDRNPQFIPDYRCISFHETKNIQCGEGGALILKDGGDVIRKAILMEDCGTNRAYFLEGHVDKYTWQTLGSSYLIPEMSSTMLYQGLMNLKEITENRIASRNYYLKKYPFIKSGPNGHMVYLLEDNRDELISKLWREGIYAVSHYEPLHLSSAGKKYGRVISNMENTVKFASRIVRLPMYYGITREDIDKIMEVIYEFLNT